MRKYKQCLFIGIIMFSVILTNISYLLAGSVCICMLFGADLGLELIKFIPETKYLDADERSVKGQLWSNGEK